MTNYQIEQKNSLYYKNMKEEIMKIQRFLSESPENVPISMKIVQLTGINQRGNKHKLGSEVRTQMKLQTKLK